MAMHFIEDSDSKSKMRSTDRILSLAPKEGATAKNTGGAVDNRLFTGANKVRAIMDGETTLWHLKYDKGITPEPLKQQFTSFSKLYNHARVYFENRNIEIKEVLD